LLENEWIEGLAKNRACATPDGFGIIEFGDRADDDDRNASQCRIGSANVENVPSRDARHHEVEDDEVRLAPKHDRERFLSVSGFASSVTAALKSDQNHAADLVVVLDDENAGGRSRRSGRWHGRGSCSRLNDAAFGRRVGTTI
jgi:hypothetical protein